MAIGKLFPAGCANYTNCLSLFAAKLCSFSGARIFRPRDSHWKIKFQVVFPFVFTLIDGKKNWCSKQCLTSKWIKFEWDFHPLLVFVVVVVVVAKKSSLSGKIRSQPAHFHIFPNEHEIKGGEGQIPPKRCWTKQIHSHVCLQRPTQANEIYVSFWWMGALKRKKRKKSPTNSQFKWVSFQRKSRRPDSDWGIFFFSLQVYFAGAEKVLWIASFSEGMQ